MNVDFHTAFRLLETFSQLEFRLKNVSRFIQGEVDKPAMVQWGTVSAALDQLPPERFINMIPPAVRLKLIGEGDRPMKHLVELEAHGKKLCLNDFHSQAQKARHYWKPQSGCETTSSMVGRKTRTMSPTLATTRSGLRPQLS